MANSRRAGSFASPFSRLANRPSYFSINTWALSPVTVCEISSKLSRLGAPSRTMARNVGGVNSSGFWETTSTRRPTCGLSACCPSVSICDHSVSLVRSCPPRRKSGSSLSMPTSSRDRAR